MRKFALGLLVVAPAVLGLSVGALIGGFRPWPIIIGAAVGLAVGLAFSPWAARELVRSAPPTEKPDDSKSLERTDV